MKIYLDFHYTITGDLSFALSSSVMQRCPSMRIQYAYLCVGLVKD